MNIRPSLLGKGRIQASARGPDETGSIGGEEIHSSLLVPVGQVPPLEKL